MPAPPITLDSLAQHAGELYTLPRVAVEVLQLTRQPAVDARKLQKCLENDPALSAKLLRVVNSALFGLTRPVADLNQALAILGTKPLKLLVLGFSLPEVLFKDLERDWLNRYWQQTLVKAVAAREITPLVSRACGDEAFIAGLLQDIGMLVLIQNLGPTYLHLAEQARREDLDVGYLEQRMLGFDHTQLSARLLEGWRLPEAIIAAARLPRSPEEIEGDEARRQPLRYIVYLADLLMRVLVGGRPGALKELLEATRETADLDESQLAAVVERLQAKVPELAGVLSLDLPANVDYSQVLVAAYGQLTTVAGDAAAELFRTQRLAELEQAARSPDGHGLHKRNGHTADSTNPAVKGEAAACSTAVEESSTVLLSRLKQALADCRELRRPLALMLVDAPTGCQGLEHLVFKLECLPAGKGRLAVILQDNDRQEAVRLGHELLEAYRTRLPQNGSRETQDGSREALMSIGIAAISLPPRNFPPAELLTSAESCLFGARASGGNCLKSIER